MQVLKPIILNLNIQDLTWQDVNIKVSIQTFTYELSIMIKLG
jgi:hypothetical protein